MRWSYDLDGDALYIYLSAAPISRQVEMPDGTVVDVDAEDRAVGVDIVGIGRPVDWGRVIEEFHLSPPQLEFVAFVYEIIGALPRPRAGAAQATRSPHRTESFRPAQLIDA